MSDERIANPTYSLDVDLMILEYLIHTTIKAQIEAARHVRSGSDKSEAWVLSATTLIHVFDTFIALFKHNHPQHDFTAEQDFSLRLLGFLIMFTDRKDLKLLSLNSIDELRLYQEATVNERTRSWERVPGFRDYNAWLDLWKSGTTLRETKRLKKQADQWVPLELLLPSFLELSADVASRLGQSINEQWMRLAGEFMLQSAWESFANNCGDQEETPEPLRLTFAFAWDAWDPEELRKMFGIELLADAAEVLERQEKVSEMFEEADAEPGWQTIRSEYLSAFEVGAKDDSISPEFQSKRLFRKLKEISDDYPMHAFEVKIIDFLDGLLKLEQKPLLLQIEEGAIEGMSAEQFAEFKRKVFAPQGSMSLG